ncbi:tRNA (N(6)-L-threonylcarbamoyladenosine(37)-C(2))-methylthiotransferase MtaB [Blattabacterium cuenoti]|uniref:tRNA (N(6)-L-threonylcarbamoyladenosine(37)-C(2))- methylthiotransferase MtaB n=1 Tax=Blattabacterium cuenoti TaxID=1653831 RepID=UPI00163BBA04
MEYEKKKIAFYTIGCKLNYAETSTIKRKFSISDYEHVNFNDFADIYIINTCSVTNNAENKLKYLVRYAIRKNSKSKIVAIGCYAQYDYEKISSIDGIDLVLNNKDKFDIINFIKNDKYEKKININKNFNFISSFSIENRTRSFLKIQDGCNYKCSYCSIPISRGFSRSEEIKNILNYIDLIFDKGVKEIVLTGINIGDYKYNKNIKNFKFFDLIQIINNHIEKRKEKKRIRLSSIEPNLLKDEIIEYLSRSKYFVPHFHIPLQSGSNKILKSMRRRYQKELYEEKIKKIRYYIPNAYIGSDIIVGFPGETYKNFLETYFFLKKLYISSIHVFTYSHRYNINSIFLNKMISEKIKKKRNYILRNLSKKKYYYFCNKQIKTIKTVLFEKNMKNSKYLYGYTENYIRTKISYSYISSKYENTFQNVLLKKIDHKDDIVIVEPFI